MAASPIRAAFPSGPLTDPTLGEPTPIWRTFLQTLWTRTGGAGGVSTAELAATVAAGATTLTNADMALGHRIEAETAGRTVADTAEAAARALADAALQANKLAVNGSQAMTGPLVAPVVQTGGVGGATWRAGAGPPGTAVAPAGSLYSNTTVPGAVGARLYVSQGGGTWLAVAGV